MLHWKNICQKIFILIPSAHILSKWGSAHKTISSSFFVLPVTLLYSISISNVPALFLTLFTTNCKSYIVGLKSMQCADFSASSKTGKGLVIFNPVVGKVVERWGGSKIFGDLLLGIENLLHFFWGGVEKFPHCLSKTFYITLSGETLSGEIFVGRNYSSGEIFVTKRKIRHFRPTKNFAQ